MNVNKREIPLNPSWNIMAQAENEVNSILDFCLVSEPERRDISWKVFSKESGRFMFVSRSANWVD